MAEGMKLLGGDVDANPIVGSGCSGGAPGAGLQLTVLTLGKPSCTPGLWALQSATILAYQQACAANSVEFHHVPVCLDFMLQGGVHGGQQDPCMGGACIATALHHHNYQILAGGVVRVGDADRTVLTLSPDQKQHLASSARRMLESLTHIIASSPTVADTLKSEVSYVWLVMCPL